MVTLNDLKIGNKVIGQGNPVYIIAEISANHNQDIEEAIKLIRVAKNAGVDAIKIQTYTPDTITINCSNHYFKIGKGSPWEGKSLYDLYKEAYMPWDWQPKLKKVANDMGMDLFSSPFDKSAVDFLEQMDVPAYKIASFELVDIPLIKYVAKKGKPIIMSTGMASSVEIMEAVTAAQSEGCNEIALLKCTSAYPAKPKDMNLSSIPKMMGDFNKPVGLSDHTLGVCVPVAAVALGACIVEKHFTMSRRIPGPDSSFSLEPNELKNLVEVCRLTEKALGRPINAITNSEVSSNVFRRSLFIVEDMVSGEIITEKNVRSIRPGNGLMPKFFERVIGKRVNCDIKRGTPLLESLISNF